MTDDGPRPRDGRSNGRPSRRQILAGVGLGGATMAGYYAFDEFSGSPDESRWEPRIDGRIEKHRSTPITVTVVDGQGDPVRDALVEVSMQDHEFGFGTAVDAEYLVRETEAGDNYRTYITELFNKAVLENRHKWAFWETPEDRSMAEAATEWLRSRGLEVRGHTCIWQKRNQGAIPEDVLSALDANDGEHVAERALEHVEDIVGHYRNQPGFTEWDVLNEQVEYHEMTDVIEPSESHTTARVILDWYRTAREAAPDAQLYLNEYNVLAGDETDHKDAFEALVTHLLDNDAPLEGLGLQAHYSSPDQRRTPGQLLATLDRFADLVPALQVQEYDTWGDGWTEAMEAEYLRAFLKTVYSHPATEGFLVWGFWDGIHWQGNAPLFRADWSKKPAYDVYTDLVFDQWWTDECGHTDGDGEFRTDGHLGEYELTASTNGATVTKDVSVEDPSRPTRFTLQVSG